MISGLVLKDLNGERFVIRRGYETTLPVSSSFCLTVPCLAMPAAGQSGRAILVARSLQPLGSATPRSFGRSSALARDVMMVDPIGHL